MTALDSLIERMEALGVRLFVEKGELRFRAPRGAMTPELLQEIRSQQAALLDRVTARDGSRIPRRPDAERYPLSDAQRRLWILHELDPASPAYNVPFVQLLDGPLDVAALAAAFSLLEERHASLRTIFGLEQGVPYQRIEPPRPADVAVIDVRADTDPEAAARARVGALVLQPFDLERERMYRVELLRLTPARHVLALLFHHIAADGVSLAVLARELSAAYAAFRAGRAPELEPLPIRYCDFAAWQAAYLESDEAAVHREYWRGTLVPPLPRVDVPADRPRPAIASAAGAEELIQIGAADAAQFRRVCRENGATLFMGLLALVQALLHRYTGARDIVIGTPVAGRDHADTASLVGVFINTLVLRGIVSPGLPFSALLTSTRRTVTEGLDHAAYPFDRLVHDLDVDRDPARSPLVDVMVILQNQQTGSFALDGLTVSPLYEHTGTSKFDLTFNFHEGADGISVAIEYRTDLFDVDRIRRMGGHLSTLLRAAVRTPSAPVGALELLTDAERDQLVHGWNRTARALPLERTVVDLCRERAAAGAAATAVRCGSEALTFGEVDRRSSAIAAALRSRGARAGSIVGLCVDRSMHLPVALLGILKSGAAYLPLDPDYPAERLEFLLRDSGASLVLTERQLSARVPPGHADLIFVDEAMSCDALAVDTRVDPDDAAYVIYTSGSTGTPKGVEVTHRNLTSFLLAMAEAPGLSAGDVLLAVTSPSFDIAGLELFLPLVAGARIVVATREDATDGTRLATLLSASHATIMQATPSTWRLLFASGWSGAPALKVLCGGDRLQGPLAAALVSATREVWNMYGPTETTIWSLCHRIDDAVAGDPPIGHPIANATAYLLDASGNLTPDGVPGELCIGGPGVTRGYRGRPDLTADRFVPDPFGARGGRLYRTGDQARRLADGTIQFLGRDDQQIKVRGFRVEIGEVEAALLRDAAVREAAVAAPEDGAGDRMLVAYVVPGASMPWDATALRARLAASLPQQALPSIIVPLAALPLTPNGKVDRRALPRPMQERAGPAPGGAPRDSFERSIHDAVAAVLERASVGIDEDFFEAGGHSLRATRAAHLLQDALGIDVALVDIFRAPTIAGLAARLRERTPRDAGALRRTIAPITAEEAQLLGDPL